jgi:uncharacterized membrane protein YdjX (TVP38/TMEM64 family)
VVEAIAITDPERPVSLDTLVEQFAFEEEIREKRHVHFAKKAALAAAALVALVLVWRFTPLAEAATAENVLDWVQRFAGQWWAPLVVVLAYTPASLVMFPRPLITLASVVAFSPWTGFALAIAGNLLAAALAYVAGRVFGRNTVRRIAGEKLNRLCNALRRRGLLAMTAIRLVPIAPFAVESVVAGAIRIRFWHFALGTFIGMLPGTLATTVFGGQIETALRDPSQINYWLVGGVVLLLAVGALVVRRWLAKIDATEKSREPASPRRPGRDKASGGRADLVFPPASSIKRSTG